MSSYSTLKPETVSEAETQEMTKLLEVISVTDSEMSTIGGGGVVSPCVVATAGQMEKTTEWKNVRAGDSLCLISLGLAAMQRNNVYKRKKIDFVMF